MPNDSGSDRSTTNRPEWSPTIAPFFHQDSSMRSADSKATERRETTTDNPQLEVVIEVPRWSFLKRGSNGSLDFISPLPCPFNYGSVETLIGLEGDLLDAVVLGPRLQYGSRVTVQAFGAVGMTDRGMYDDKLICSSKPLTARQRWFVLLFFRIYAKCKGGLNFLRGWRGRNACEGWGVAQSAIARATPRMDQRWQGPGIPF
jgi:inorganic pyrophosphatase